MPRRCRCAVREVFLGAVYPDHLLLLLGAEKNAVVAIYRWEIIDSRANAVVAVALRLPSVSLQSITKCRSLALHSRRSQSPYEEYLPPPPVPPLHSRFGRRVVCIVGAALALMLSDLCGDDDGRVCAVRVRVCVGAAETM